MAKHQLLSHKNKQTNTQDLIKVIFCLWDLWPSWDNFVNLLTIVLRAPDEVISCDETFQRNQLSKV